MSINFYTQSKYYRNFHDGGPYHAPSAKKVLLKMFPKLTGKQPCWSLFFTQQPATLLKKIATQRFSRKFCEIYQNTFFTERLWKTAVSKKCRISLDRCSIKKYSRLFRKIYRKTALSDFLFNKITNYKLQTATLLKRNSDTSVSLCILRNFRTAFLWKPRSDSIC